MVSLPKDLTLRLPRFKGFAPGAALSLQQPLTLLIGRNGTGKTNALEAFKLLAHLCRGGRLPEVTDVGGYGGYLEVRGGLPGCVPQDGGRRMALGLDLANHDGALRYDVAIDVDERGARIATEELIVHEGATQSVVFHLKAGQGPGAGFVVIPPDTGFPVSDDRTYLGRADGGGEKTKAADELREAVRWLVDFRVFDFHPEAMRQFADHRLHQMAPNGFNVSAAAYALRATNPEGFRQVEQFIATIPDADACKLGFVEAPNGQVMLELEEATGRKYDARVLSDGTLRAIAVAVAMETTNPGSVVTIEEIERGLHPARARALVKHILEAGSRRDARVLATTHSPAVLDALTVEQYGSIVVARRGAGGHELVPFWSLPGAEYLAEKGRLGAAETQEGLTGAAPPSRPAVDLDALLGMGEP
ncbi:MAG: ATP-binding protein [Deltaproteobacteria bacterium]|nr:ATP-binding protein [Deltaproteobacteria bacterium]